MQLDLYRNELIFSSVRSPAAFVQLLQRGKGLKFNQSHNKFHISLAYLNVARQVLRECNERIQLSIRYEKFAHLFVANKEPIRIEWYPAECTISGQGVPWDAIIPATSYFTKEALQSSAYKQGKWDGTVHLFNAVDGKFPSGLLERIIMILNERKINYTIDRKFDYPEPVFTLKPTFEFEPTEDQQAAEEALAKANNGVAKLPTGFGKTSFVSAALIARKGVRSLFLANQRILINDAKKDFQQVFRDNLIKIGVIGDGEFDPGDITVASIQGIVAALEPPSTYEYQNVMTEIKIAQKELERITPNHEETMKLEKNLKKAMKKLDNLNKRKKKSALIRPFLESVQLFIVDESQVLGTEMWNKFLHACPAPYRYTLSATDTRTDGGRIQIIAATGERRFESSAADQIKKGRLSEFMAHFRKFDHGIDKDLVREIQMDYNQAYNLFIVHNDKRNDHLCDKTIAWAKEGYSVLALVTRVEHGEIIQQIMVDKGMPDNLVPIIHGNTSKKLREETIDEFRAGRIPILIGTSIFDVGFNAKNASKMVRFNGGGSEVREPQRAGRTVRKRDDDSIGETYDMLDMNVPYFESQAWKRIKILMEEFGKQRVKIHHDVIQGELDIVSLREVLGELPAETDREKGMEIVDEILNRREIENLSYEKDDQYDKVLNDPNLANLFKEMEWK